MRGAKYDPAVRRPTITRGRSLVVEDSQKRWMSEIASRWVKSCPRNASGKRILHFSNRFGNRAVAKVDAVLGKSPSAMSSAQISSRQEFQRLRHRHRRQSIAIVKSHREVFTNHSAARSQKSSLGTQE